MCVGGRLGGWVGFLSCLFVFVFFFFFFFLKGREGGEFVRDILKLVDYLLTQADKP